MRGDGVNFSVFSRNATALKLLLFDRADGPRPATAAPPTTAPPTSTRASSGPLATRGVQFVSAQRAGDNNQALATLSLEFTGGAGPYTLSGDGIASPTTKNITGTFTDNGVTYNYIHFEVASSCGAQMPGTVHIRDSGGQSASQTYFVTVNCP